MRTLATPRREARGTRQETGTITRREGGRFAVRAESGLLSAERAASCLLEPEVGDRVLVALTSDDEAFVLAVLRREAAASPARLSVEGDLALAAPSGTLSIEARDGVAVVSPATIDLTASELRLAASRARTALGELVHVGSSVLAQVDAAKLVGEALDTVLERSVARVRRAFRFVEEGDTLRAGEVDYRAEGLASVRGEHTVVTAEKLVKLDGGQIHVG